MTQKLSRRKPQKWVEWVISLSVPCGDKKEKLLELREMFRERLKEKGEKAALAMARHEALHWFIRVWPFRIWLAYRLVKKFITQG